MASAAEAVHALLEMMAAVGQAMPEAAAEHKARGDGCLAAADHAGALARLWFDRERGTCASCEDVPFPTPAVVLCAVLLLFCAMSSALVLKRRASRGDDAAAGGTGRLRHSSGATGYRLLEREKLLPLWVSALGDLTTRFEESIRLQFVSYELPVLDIVEEKICLISGGNFRVP